MNGVLFSGSGLVNPSGFSFNTIRSSVITVRSNGLGNKRGILVSGSNQVSVRDVNIFVDQPRQTTSAGSYVGVQTADPVNIGSIQLRSSTIGVVRSTGGQAYSASDILQTSPSVFTEPTYLASSGIQIGPGTDLVTKSAGGRGFSTFLYPTIVYYGLTGSLNLGPSGYLWPGSRQCGVSYPDIGTPPAYFRAQQKCLVSGLLCGLRTGAGGANSVTVTVKYTPVGGAVTTTSFVVTMAGSATTGSFYNGSVALGVGDSIHVQVAYTGTTQNLASDLTVQLNVF